VLHSIVGYLVPGCELIGSPAESAMWSLQTASTRMTTILLSPWLQGEFEGFVPCVAHTLRNVSPLRNFQFEFKRVREHYGVDDIPIDREKCNDLVFQQCLCAWQSTRHTETLSQLRANVIYIKPTYEFLFN